MRLWQLALAIALAGAGALAGISALARAQDRVTQRVCTDDGGIPVCPDPARD